VPHRIACAEQPHGPAGSAAAPAHVGEATWLGFGLVGRFAEGDVVQKGFDVFASDGGDGGAAPKERLDVPPYASTIGSKPAGLFGRAAARRRAARPRWRLRRAKEGAKLAAARDDAAGGDIAA
jgi:hypothetical protein